MGNIAENLRITRGRIHAAAQKYGRAGAAVTLVAVSKGQSVDRLHLAAAAGQRVFGENYVSEAVPKITALKGGGLIWHYIGAIQSNKTAAVAAHFDWVHALDREKTARRISEARLAGNREPIDACIQVNLSGEPGKSGVAPAGTEALADRVRSFPGIRLRGLMIIPAPATEIEAQRRVFREARLLLETLNARGFNLDTLSMGMSGDYEAAIAEGATMVRIGTAIFGPRSVV